jgi:glutamyl/glutaminyl-tRNA synthetase
MSIRTRFAPSPTGYLHIGGVRTALFNWLLAKRLGGKFILRIDDTDTERNRAEALQPILDGFKWLGLNWDEGPEVGGPHGPYYQSQKLARYQEAVKQLLDRGLAYWDYATSEDMKREREQAEKEKRPYLYSRNWKAETDEEHERFKADRRTPSVRLKMPRSGVCEFTDHIRGEVRVEWATEQDTVIQRSDGTVTYNLANVVDDFDMKITHVIRAEEHLSNTPRQIFMLEGLGYPRPGYAHVPFVAEPGSKNKLSKRKIGQYLKNPDFKKVYEHGRALAEKQLTRTVFEVAGRLKRSVDELIHNKRVTHTPSLDNVIYEELVKRLENKLSELRVGLKDQTKQVIVNVVAEMVEDIRANPGYLESYQYGERILKQLGPELPAETFNPVIVDFYRLVGFLPDALLNYLVLLGWSLDDKTEDFTRQQMIDLFSLERVNKAPASFDAKKLFAFQGRYMQALPLDKKVDMVLPFLVSTYTLAGNPKPNADPVLPADREYVRKIVAAIGPRLNVAGDILDYDYLFLPDDRITFDPATAEKQLRDAFKGSDRTPTPLAESLPALRKLVADAEPFDAATLKQRTEELAQSWGAKAGPLSNVMRVATTGREVGFSAYDTFAILGRDRCLARIDRAMKPGEPGA